MLNAFFNHIKNVATFLLLAGILTISGFSVYTLTPHSYESVVEDEKRKVQVLGISDEIKKLPGSQNSLEFTTEISSPLLNVRSYTSNEGFVMMINGAFPATSAGLFSVKNNSEVNEIREIVIYNKGNAFRGTVSSKDGSNDFYIPQNSEQVFKVQFPSKSVKEVNLQVYSPSVDLVIEVR